jgi:hypothetical protein
MLDFPVNVLPASHISNFSFPARPGYGLMGPKPSIRVGVEANFSWWGRESIC